ncbi:MAG: class I SAM-dependent methyltransferase [Candidatus Sulfotelmatobacter sp.]
MIEQKNSDVQSSYDSVADEYVRHIYDELRHKPLDRQLLDRFANGVRGVGLVCDLGCGPGQVARYLYERGIAVCGVDLSQGMVERARQLNPGIEFNEGEMKALDVPDEAWAGIAAFYAIVNLSPAEVAQALREIQRVLRPGGLLLLSFHIGDGVSHEENLWGRAVCLDFYFFRPGNVAAYLRVAGFEIEEIIEREPYAPEVEYQSRRAYIFARKAAAETTTA